MVNVLHDVNHGIGVLGIQPFQAFVLVDCRSLPSLSFIFHVSVVKGKWPDRPCSYTHNSPVVLFKISLQFVEAVVDFAIAFILWFPNAFPHFLRGNLQSDDPPSSIAFFALSFIAFALLLISSDSSPIITFLIASAMASLFTPSQSTFFHSFDPTPVPIRKISVISFSFKNWSANRGHVTIGTPAQTPSRVEFHPQWVTNAPTAGWSRIRTWGAQPLMINPFPLVLSSNPSGIHFSDPLSSSLLFLITHTKSIPEASIPIAISWS
nr:hypothetical protein AT4G34139 [Ipomoea batatas]